MKFTPSAIPVRPGPGIDTLRRDFTIKTKLSSRIIDGRLIEDISLTAIGPNIIEHGLDRSNVNYIVVDSNVALLTNKVSVDSVYLELASTSDATVSLWVF